MAGIETIRKEIKRLADPEKAKILQRFFKTGPGQYGEGDVFAGITVPVISETRPGSIATFPSGTRPSSLKSPIHEERLLALLILVEKARRGDDATRKRIYSLYLKNTRTSTAGTSSIFRPSTSSAHGLPTGTERSLYRLAKSKSLWERRIAIVATFHDIKRGNPDHTLALADVLMARPARPHPQGRGVDAPRGGKTLQRRHAAGISADTLPIHAPDHAPLRHRALPRSRTERLPSRSRRIKIYPPRLIGPPPSPRSPA